MRMSTSYRTADNVLKIGKHPSKITLSHMCPLLTILIISSIGAKQRPLQNDGHKNQKLPSLESCAVKKLSPFSLFGSAWSVQDSHDRFLAFFAQMT